MKRVRILLFVFTFAAMSFTGYTTYGKMTMTETEKLMLANIEAIAGDATPFWLPGPVSPPWWWGWLTPGESGGDGVIADADGCVNGGRGSTGCAISAGISIAGCGLTTGCDVSCGSGYFSCCSMRCRCTAV